MTLKSIALVLILVLLLAGCGGGEDNTPVPQATLTPTLTPTPSVAAEGLTIALAYNGDLYLWNFGDDSPRQVMQGQVDAPYFAPDGAHIAVTRGNPGLPETLWVIDRDGANGRLLEARPIISQVVWFDAATLYFNTAEEDMVSIIPRNDLFRVTVDGGRPARVTPGGNLSVSPQKTRLVVSVPGTYGEIPGHITLVELQGDRAPIELLQFDSVATASHRHFYPEIQWVDEDTFYTTIPDPDAIYNELTASGPPAQYWQFTLAGGDDFTSTEVDVEASYFGLPVRSPQTGQIAYLHRAVNPNQLELVIANADDSVSQTIVTADVGDILPPQWIGDRLLYAHDGAYWIAAPGETPIRWLEINPDAMSSPLVVGDLIVYSTANGENIELRYANLNDAAGTSGLIVNAGPAPVTFDAVVSS